MKSTVMKTEKLGKLRNAMNKETIEVDKLYKGPQIAPLFSSLATQNSNCTNSQNYSENSCFSSVIKRVATLEMNLEKSKKRLKHALSVIKEKDSEIIKLNEKIKLLEDEKKCNKVSPTEHSEISEMKNVTKSLQNRVSAIENVLKGDPYYYYKTDINGNDIFCHCTSGNLESPDLDLILRQISEMNYEAGEIRVYERTKQGAAFQGCQSLPLTFYANGMQLDGHPFRSYSDLRTQFFIKDILDGFFPSELQGEYPSGVMFNVCDRREDVYNDNCEYDLNLFKGQGCKLDTRTDKSNLKEINKNRGDSHHDIKIEKGRNNFVNNYSNASGSVTTQIVQLQKDLFKKRIPDSMTRNLHSFNGSGAGDGNHSIYRQNNNDKFSLPSITIKDGQLCNKMLNKSSFKKNSHINATGMKYLNPNAKSTESSVQLKIRSINDKDMFIITMHINEPVSKLRSYLPDEVKECNIMFYMDDSTRIYLTDNKTSLRDCGILKNSVLVLCKTKICDE